MTVPVVSSGRRDCGCGAGDCPDPGDCPEGQECLPSDFVAPCDEGSECLPSNFIDPDDCPACGSSCCGPNVVDFTIQDGLNGSDEIVLTKPTGLADGDVLYLFVNAFGASLTGGGTNYPQPPSGFSQIYAQLEALTGNIAFVGCFRKVVTSAAGEPASYTVGAPTGPGYGASKYGGGILYAVRGADTAAPEDDSGVAQADTGPATTGAALDSSSDHALLFVNITNSGTLTPTTPLGMTNDFAGDGGDARCYSESITSQLVSDSRSSDVGAGDWVLGFVVVAPDPACLDCGCQGDYVPYCMSANADDPATVIVGLGPWSYYPLDDASGLPVDASGNGRDVTSTGGGTITYSAAAITSKRTASIEFEGGYFVLPKPFNLDSGNEWSVIWLEEVETFHGSGSPAQASALFGEANGSTPAAFTVVNSAGGDLYELWGSQAGINSATYVQDADIIGRPAVICLVADPASQPRLYIDGVRWGAAQNGGLIGPTNLCLGASDNGFWGYPLHRISDFALFDRGLTDEEIISVTAALMDASAFSTSMSKR